MIMWIMSDRAIPRSYRTMEGFGVHTFRLVDVEGRSTFVKFHWKPKQGLQSVVWNEAVKINGADPDFHRRDLWDAINRSEEHTSELQSLMRISYAVFCLKKKKNTRKSRIESRGIST